MPSLVGICNGVLNSVASGDGFVATCSSPFVGVDVSFFLGSTLDLEALSVAFGGCLVLFAVGAGVGAVINVIKKARI